MRILGFMRCLQHLNDSRVLMTRFSDWMIGETLRALWAAMQRGEFITYAAEQAGTYRKKDARYHCGRRGPTAPGSRLEGPIPVDAEREVIALGLAAG
jgi:hypothetical protein